MPETAACPQEFGFNWRKCKSCSPTVTCQLHFPNSKFFNFTKFNAVLASAPNILEDFFNWFPICKLLESDWIYLFIKAVVCHNEKAAALTFCFSLPSPSPLLPLPSPSPPPPPLTPPARVPGFHLQGENFEFFVEVPASVSRWVVTDGGAHQISSSKKGFFNPRKVCGQFHLHFCKDWLSPSDWWLPEFNLFTRPCHWQNCLTKYY